MGFGARIAELRHKREESLQKVADAAGVTKTHIWELERGRTANPSFSVIGKLADHFGVSIASLVGEDIDVHRQLGKIEPPVPIYEIARARHRRNTGGACSQL